MKIFPLHIARKNLEKLIELVLSGERVVISHKRKEAVELLKISKERQLGLLEGKLTINGT